MKHADRGEDGNLVVNPEQAEVVKRIYGMFLKGMTPHGIAKTLTDEGVPTPAGKHQWGQTTIKSILSKPNIFDLRQRHSRPDARKPLESANLLAPGAFSFLLWPTDCAGLGDIAAFGFVLP